MKTVRLMGTTIVAGASLVSTLAGCTPFEPAPMGPAPSAIPSATTTATKALPTEWVGSFVSQGTVTSGTVTLRLAGDKYTVTLTNFSTGPGKNLMLTLNPGAMTKDAAGDNVVEDPTVWEVGPLTSTSGDQSYELPAATQFNLPDFRSVSIYQSLPREAFGTANLTPVAYG
jgi:hypothetical protein